MLLPNSFHVFIKMISITLLMLSFSSVASPFNGMFDHQQNPVNRNADYTNSWHRSSPVSNYNTIRNYQQHNNYQQNYRSQPAVEIQQPSFSTRSNDSRFISRQELDALNKHSYTSYGSRYSQDWNPLSDMGGSMYGSDFGDSPYNPSYSNHGYSDSNYGYQNDSYQWGNNYAVMPVDPMGLGRYGAPFNGTFNGIEPFLYE